MTWLQRTSITLIAGVLPALGPGGADAQTTSRATVGDTAVSNTSAVSTTSASPRAAVAAAASSPSATYWVYVAAESADRIHRVRFGPGGAAVEKTTEVGEISVEIEGPHGLRISPDGRHLYMTTGHGVPNGKLWKFDLGPDTLVADPLPLGPFPATLDLTPDALYAFIVNFNLHGDRVPSSVSVVYTPTLMEVARTTTCVTPHGSRLSPDGTRHYSACVHDDLLVEIDARSFDVARRFSVAVGAEGPVAADNGRATDGGAAGTAPTCSPTWAQPSPDGRFVYVACNGADTILEIDVDEWRVARRFTTGRAPYNLAVAPDGRTLVATLKAHAAVQFFDLETGESRAITPATTTVTHGVVVSPDSRYAFVTSEGVGAEPGRVDVFDLGTLERVASVDVAQQAGGIAFWKWEREGEGEGVRF